MRTLLRATITATFLVLLMAMDAGGAYAQGSDHQKAQPQQRALCAPSEAMTKELGDRYDETRRSVGLSNRASLIEMYASPSGSWTMLRTLPTGVSCIIDAGQHWREVEPQIPGSDS